MEALPPPPFSVRFYAQAVRWFTWCLSVGVGFHAGRVLVAIFSGSGGLINSLVDLLFGVFGYALIGLVVSGISGIIAAAVTRTVPHRNRTIRVALIVAGIAALIGVYGHAATTI